MTLKGHSVGNALAVHKDTIISCSRQYDQIWTLKGNALHLKGSMWSLAVHKDTIISGSLDKRSNLTLEGNASGPQRAFTRSRALALHKDTIISGSEDNHQEDLECMTKGHS